MHGQKFFILTTSPWSPRRGNSGQRRKLPLLAWRDGVASCVEASRGARCSSRPPTRANAHLSSWLYQVNPLVMFPSNCMFFTFSGLDLGPSLEDQPVTSKVNLASVLSPSDDVLALFREEKVRLPLKISDKILIKLTGRGRGRGG